LTERWKRKVLTPEDIRAAIQEIIKTLEQGVPYQAKTTVFNVYLGKLTERDSRTDKKIGQVYFGQLLFVTLDKETWDRMFEQLRGFIHSKGTPIVEFFSKETEGGEVD